MIYSYGGALKHFKLVLESRAHLTNGSCENILLSYLLGRAGDCCFQIAKNWDIVEKLRADFVKVENCDAKMVAAMNEEEVQQYAGMIIFECVMCFRTVDSLLCKICDRTGSQK